MKAVAFDYARPRTVGGAIRLLSEKPDAKILAGGQTLGPMLNLRLAQPSLLVDITRIAELAEVEEAPDSVTLGATITHAAVEDGRVPDPARGLLQLVANGIAYRAVRTRGTIGGSLAHADPSADWLSCFTALEATVVIAGPFGRRYVPIMEFMRGALDTGLEHDELLVAIKVPKLSTRARYGYHKICRKTGEFAEAIGVAVDDPGLGIVRLVAGSTQGRPIVVDGIERLEAAADCIEAKLLAAGLGDDAYELSIHVAAVKRAIAGALAA
ncbi:MAG: FAD binding domain-containing protein [Hyphomicrobiaceae bacterium]|nr:FAD binding domain-containing protein [Hyphomicrobiaceae bacterium]